MWKEMREDGGRKTNLRETNSMGWSAAVNEGKELDTFDY